MFYLRHNQPCASQNKKYLQTCQVNVYRILKKKIMLYVMEKLVTEINWQIRERIEILILFETPIEKAN